MSLKKIATSGLVWTFTQQFGNQLIGFFVSLVLARILLPEEFGLIGMIVVVVAIGNALLEGGLTKSLIQDKESNQEDYSTVFYFQLFSSIVVYIVVFILAPFIAEFYEEEVLINIIRVYSLSLIITSFSAIQLARLTKLMDFKTQTLIAIPATLIGGIAGILMAYAGYGVWSLVWSSIITSSIHSIQVWFYSGWTPDFMFSSLKFKKHFNYGYKLTLSDLLNRIFNNIFLIVIGRYFSAGQVGFYTRAETMKQLPVHNISSALNKVSFPLLVSIKDDELRLRRVYKKLMLMVVFVITPILIISAVLAEPIFRFLFTEKWLPAVPYFQILCVTGILFPIHSYNLTILNVKGRSDLFLKLEVIKKVLIVIIILLAIPYGILALLYGQVIISLLAFFINANYTRKFIGYSGWQQVRDIFPIILIACFSGLIVFVVDHFALLNQLDILRIIIGGIIGGLSYVGFAFVFRFSSLPELYKLILNK